MRSTKEDLSPDKNTIPERSNNKAKRINLLALLYIRKTNIKNGRSLTIKLPSLYSLPKKLFRRGKSFI